MIAARRSATGVISWISAATDITWSTSSAGMTARFVFFAFWCVASAAEFCEIHPHFTACCNAERSVWS
ncbi:MAG: hypothetical protein HYX32_09290 [Actinobacteria bacterium]|nr:hypothetical protein [Actinomycetota bacterium]